MHTPFSTKFKRTKIVATLGPTSQTEETIRELILHGLNVARLNFSHGTHEDHKSRIQILRSLQKELGTHIAIMQDLQGPKIRLGNLVNGSRMLTNGEEVTLVHGAEQKEEETTIPVQYNIFPYLEKNHEIFINDGIIKLKVLSATKDSAVCKVIAGGEIKNHKGVNLPDTVIPSASLTEKDKKDLELGVSEKVDYIAISFVQSGDDIVELRNILAKHDHQPKIIVKIETKSAVKNLEKIIELTDAVMVARGDLAVEVGQEEVPLLQRTIIKLTKKYNKPVIVATQMLESMVHSVEPTRAEVNDVATAVLDQVDAVMLSAETASGDYPVQTVTMMDKIIRHVEKVFHQSHKLDEQITVNHTEAEDQTTAIAASATLLAHQLHAQLMCALTSSGNTALRISSYRPHAPIIALTDTMKVVQQLALVWGVEPHYLPEITTNEEAYQTIMKHLLDKGEIKKDDKVVLVSGKQPGKEGQTNIISVTQVGDIHS